MHVLCLTPNYPSRSFPFAGIFQQMQIGCLRQLGIAATVVAPTPYVPGWLKKCNDRYRKIAEIPLRSNDGPVDVIRPRYVMSPREYLLRFSHLTQGTAVWKLKLDKPDLIHAHFAYPTGAAADKLAKKWDIPYLITLHGDDVTIHPKASPWHRHAFRNTIHRADAVISVSRALAADTARMTGRKPTVLSTGICPDDFQGLSQKIGLRKKLGLPADAFVVLFIGNLLAAKGVYDLYEAFNMIHLPGRQLAYVGDGPDRPAGPGITHFGNRPYQDIPKFLTAADVLVLPSHHEGLGQVILEAGAAGLPVIGADTGGISDLLADSRGWLFTPENPSELADRIVTVQKNPEEGRRRAERLSHHVRDEHDLRKNTSKLVEIYRSLCRQ